jgi:uncharacterized protein YecT (DUF1311 family)
MPPLEAEVINYTAPYPEANAMTIVHTIQNLSFAGLVLLTSSIPSLAQTAEPAVDCNNAQTQLEMNLCAGRAAKESDRQLNIAYKKVQNSYKSTDTPADDRARQQKALTNAQLAWIKYRDSNCTWQASKFDGGSIQPMIYANCVDRMSQERTQELLESLEP